jgi:hypothetical protein
VSKLLFTCFLFVFSFSSAQLPGLSSRILDPSSGTYFKDITDPFSAVLNPASNAQIRKRTFAFSGEKRYGFRLFNFLSASVALPVSSGCWGGQVDYFGFNKYAETQISISYARSLGERADIGLRFNLFHIRIVNFPNRIAIYPHLGFRYAIHKNLILGLSVSNPTGVIPLENGRQFQPLIFRLGVGYILSDVTAIAAEIIKEEKSIPGVICAIRYRPLPVFSIRLGINTVSRQPFANFLLQKKNWQYVVGFLWHQELGFSPSTGGNCFF